MEDTRYHELPNHPREDAQPQGRLGFLGTRTIAKLCCAIFVIVALAIAVFFLWPRDPKVEVVGIDFEGLDLNTTGGVHLDVDLQLEIEVENPNFFSVRYDRIGVRIFYHGDDLGTIKSSGGRVPARKAANLTANVTVEGLEVVKHAADLISDAEKEEIPLSVAVGFDGNVEILGLSPSIKVTIHCDLVLDPSNNTILREQCGNGRIAMVSSAAIAAQNLLQFPPTDVLPTWAWITIAVALGLLLLGLLAWLLWPKTPELTVEDYQLLGFNADSKFTDNSMIPEVVLNINLGLDLRVRNRNVLNVRYDKITVSVMYYGYEVCKGEVHGGKIPARGTVDLNATLDLHGAEIFYNSAQLLADVSRRELPLHTHVVFSGNVGIWLIRPHITAEVGYDLVIDPVNQEIVNQDYQLPKVSL